MTDDEESRNLALANAKVRAARAAQLKGQAALKSKRKPAKHRVGMHWYALVDAFDPAKIEATPVTDGGFLMGVLNDLSVVEVPETTSMEHIVALGQKLNELGIPALVVRRGIRFFSLRSCDAAEERRLNAIVAQREAEAADASRTGD